MRDMVIANTGGRPFTTKQMGDATEMLIAAELNRIRNHGDRLDGWV